MFIACVLKVENKNQFLETNLLAKIMSDMSLKSSHEENINILTLLDEVGNTT